MSIVVEALRFYANRNNYFTGPGELSAIHQDCGNLAISALDSYDSGYPESLPNITPPTPLSAPEDCTNGRQTHE